MRAWEAFGDLFQAWREEWTEDTEECRAKRAMRFAHAGMPSLKLDMYDCLQLGMQSLPSHWQDTDNPL
eukprot:2628261-Pleurochrysis_carterae.AAC.1